VFYMFSPVGSLPVHDRSKLWKASHSFHPSLVHVGFYVPAAGFETSFTDPLRVRVLRPYRSGADPVPKGASLRLNKPPSFWPSAIEDGGAACSACCSRHPGNH
jgi:hypothetical protein